ncbi:YdhR family protein [Carboxylicivirga sp. RSCT41]|uniref:YdhR family protein n=1 Tax=Carboxylicivirga agarovorans TaxID=3417570 RepID=UPI003D352991
MKLINCSLSYIVLILTLISCTGKIDNKTKSDQLAKNKVTQQTETKQKGAIMLIVRGKTKLTEEEIELRMKERAPRFRELSGLIQKYYIKTKNPGEFGGVYIWDSMESFTKYKESDLVKTIAAAYELTETPSTELIDIMFELRE